MPRCVVALKNQLIPRLSHQNKLIYVKAVNLGCINKLFSSPGTLPSSFQGIVVFCLTSSFLQNRRA